MSDRSDPDAIWKPGYDGPVRAVRSETLRPTARRRWPAIAVGAALAASSVVVGLTVVRLGASEGDEPAPQVLAATLGEGRSGEAPWGEVPSSPSGRPIAAAEPGESSRVATVASAVSPHWTVRLGTGRVVPVAAGDRTVVAVVDRPGTLVAYEEADGTERWRAPAPGESPTGVYLVDGVVILGRIDSFAVGEVTAHDLETGVPQWRRPLAVGEALVVADDQILITRVRRISGRPPGADVIDARSGVVVDRRRTDEVPSPAGVRLNEREGRLAAELPDGSSVVIDEGRLVARTLAGATLWRRPINERQTATVVSGGVVLIEQLAPDRSMMIYLGSRSD